MLHLAVIWRLVIVIIATLKQVLGSTQCKDDSAVRKTLTGMLSTQNMDFRQQDPKRLIHIMINVLSVEGSMWIGSGVMVQLNGVCS